MNRTVTAVIIAGILSFMATTGCKKETARHEPSLDNTSWRLVRERWVFPNGDSTVFQKNSPGEGASVWLFLGDQKVKILHEPYTFQQNGTWVKSNTGIIIRMWSHSGDAENVLEFSIKEVSPGRLLLAMGSKALVTATSEKGVASGVYYELVRQQE